MGEGFSSERDLAIVLTGITVSRGYFSSLNLGERQRTIWVSNRFVLSFLQYCDAVITKYHLNNPEEFLPQRCSKFVK